MEYTCDALRNKLLQQVYEVYNVFKEFFGEDYVDLQSDEQYFSEVNLSGRLLSYFPQISEENGIWNLSEEDYNSLKSTFDDVYCNTIVVWWPKVTVTNEFDKSVEIQDLYAKVSVTLDGRIPVCDHGFTLNRATYNAEQWFAGYCHSHVPRIYNNDFASVSSFREPCLGTGPIRHTISTLKINGDTINWLTFCQELALYVTVESLTGGPYIKLESIKTSNKRRYGFSNFTTVYDESHCLVDEETLRDFVAYYLKYGNLKFSYGNGHYYCSLPYYEYIVDISNCFIQWVNCNKTKEEVDKYMADEVLIPVYVNEGRFYEPNILSESTLNNIAACKILTFKGQNIMLKVETTEQADLSNIANIMNHFLAMCIIQKILKVINYRYRNEHINRKELPSTSCKKLYYI